MCDRPRDTELLSLDQLHKTPSSVCGDLPLGRAVEGDEVITEAIRPCNPPGAFCARHWPTRSTYARHRMRHGYDTRRCGLGGAFAGVSQTAVYDTCGSAPSASHRRTAPSRWTCSATPCGPRASTRRPTSTTTSRPASATTTRTRQPRRPHPSSASDSTNRTRSACRERECFW